MVITQREQKGRGIEKREMNDQVRVSGGAGRKKDRGGEKVKKARQKKNQKFKWRFMLRTASTTKNK